MAYIYDLSDTWNAAGTTFFGIKMNVTNSASASGSKLLSLQVASTEYFGVDKNGNVTIGNGGDLRISSATGGDDSIIYNDAEDLYFNTNGAVRAVINSSGNVGVGTSSPGGKLDVAGVFKVQVNGDVYGASGNAGAILLCGGSAYNAGGAVKLYGSSGGDAVAFYTGAFSERMRIDSSGNLGIGTSSPGARLDVRAANIADGTNGGIINVYSTTAQAVNVGGKLDLGGLYDGSNSLSFASVAGRKENSTSGDWSGYMQFSTRRFGGDFAERMRINSSGNVGIGTSSPSSKLTVGGNPPQAGAIAGVGSAGGISLALSDNTNNSLFVKHIAGGAATLGTDPGGQLAFATNGFNERIRITSSGNFLVGTTSPAAGNWSHEIKDTTTDAWPLALNATTRGMVIRNSSASSGYYAYFEYNGGTNNGSISWSGGTTSYNTTSDARIKTNIVDAPEAGGLIDSIKVRSWDFKADGAHWRYGMVAQELLEVAPEAVSVPADEEVMMGVDYSKLVPMLVKELQSLRARVAQLEGN